LKTLLALNQSDDTIRDDSLNEAISFFKSILSASSFHKVALMKLVNLLRIAGKLEEALQIVNQSPPGGTKLLCLGLIYRWMNRQEFSLVEFGKAREFEDVRFEATVGILDIYVFTDINFHACTAAGLQERPLQESNLNDAIQLVKEGFFSSHPRIQAYGSLARILTRNREDIEVGFNTLQELYSSDKDNVSILFALAAGYTATKQAGKSRPLLKRIQEMASAADYIISDTDDIQRAFLLSADLHLEAGKPELAHKLCIAVRNLNRSSARAYEMLGIIADKNGSYSEAGNLFSLASKCGGDIPSISAQQSAACLKSGKLVSAIQSCLRVLESDKTRNLNIRKEILEKARSALKN
jgi:tetratricopeptide repeat protein 21B